MANPQRLNDGERISIVEIEVRYVKEDVSQILREIKAIIRNQWLAAGALAAMVAVMDYPQLLRVFSPAEAHEVAK